MGGLYPTNKKLPRPSHVTYLCQESNTEKIVSPEDINRFSKALESINKKIFSQNLVWTNFISWDIDHRAPRCALKRLNNDSREIKVHVSSAYSVWRTLNCYWVIRLDYSSSVKVDLSSTVAVSDRLPAGNESSVSSSASSSVICFIYLL